MIDNKEKRRRNLISKYDTESIINIPIIEKIKCLFKNKYESLREIERIIPMIASINIRAKLKEQGVSRRLINNLMTGTFTPTNYSDARFKKREAAIQKQAQRLVKQDLTY